jgi:hypothetical protein
MADRWLLNLPAPQGVQLGALMALLYVPAAQISQAVTFVWGSATFLEPASQEVPTPAEKHLSEPGEDSSVPLQDWQSAMDELPKFGL